MIVVAAIIQARCGSSRLPGKVLRRVGAQTMLTHVLARAKRIPGVTTVMVTTTPDARDDAIVNLCRGAGVRWSRGQTPLRGQPGKNDVLAGYLLAAELTRADVILRITSDCPLLDPVVAGAVLELVTRDGAAYASDVHPPTLFDGCDVEALTRAALETAAREATPEEREHVTTFLWRRPVRFATANLTLPGGEDHSTLKLSVDTLDDLERVRAVYAHLPNREAWGWRDTLRAHAAAFPTPVDERARRIFSALPRCADRRAAYKAGVVAGAAGATLPNPYSTRDEPLRVAWLLGWEDVADLGRRRELTSG